MLYVLQICGLKIRVLIDVDLICIVLYLKKIILSKIVYCIILT